MQDTSAPASDTLPVRAAATSRRSFLGTAAGLTGAALAAGAWTPVSEPRYPSPVAERGVTTGAFAIELDGATAFLKSVEGGAIKAE